MEILKTNVMALISAIILKKEIIVPAAIAAALIAYVYWSIGSKIYKAIVKDEEH